jgi:hypothetical protein
MRDIIHCNPERKGVEALTVCFKVIIFSWKEQGNQLKTCQN